MSDFTNSLKSYLSGFQELSNWNTLAPKEKTNIKYKLASYVTIVVPLIALLVYGGSLAYDSLFGRVSQKMPENVEKQAENKYKFTKSILQPQNKWQMREDAVKEPSHLKNDTKIIENVKNPQITIPSAKAQGLEPDIIDEEFLLESESSEDFRPQSSEDEEYNENDLQGFLDVAAEDEQIDIEEQPTSISISTVNNNAESKEISNRTKYSREKLELLLKDPTEPVYNHCIVEVPEKGDCFYAAFAAGISHLLQKEYSLQDMRKIVSEEIHRLNGQNPDDNWVKNYLAKELGNIDPYENYLKYIDADYEKSIKEHGLSSPIWGKEKLDGVILCQHFKVNLNVTELLPINYMPQGVDEIAVGVTTYPSSDEKYPTAINISLYEGHFLGLVPVATK